MNKQLSKNIVFSFFSGNATPLQKKVIEQWLKEGNNLEQYYEWLEEWEREHPQFIADAEQGLQKYMLRLDKGEAALTVVKPMQPRAASVRRGFLHWWVAAATVALLLVTGIIFSKDIILYHTYQTAYGEIKTLQLEDGSIVTLNAHSSLKVPKFGFGKISRQVLLKGEAEFNIIHTIDNQPFLVHTPDQVEIKVLGTEFVVNTRAKGTKVVLSKGRVQLKSLQSIENKAEPLVMQPGDVAQVDLQGKIDIRSSQPVNMHTAWKQHLFVFDNTSLQDVAGHIEEIFGVEVILADSTLANRTITGTYKADNASELLHALSELLDLALSKNGDQVILTE